MSFWKGKKVFVTGAGGFIGSHLAERLVREGASVTSLVLYNSAGSWDWLDSSDLKDEMRVVLGDIQDRDSVTGAMEGADVVFHLAALIAIPYSYQAPDSYLRTNVEGTMNVLQAARQLGVSKIVHTSTSEVYGTAQSVPIGESHPLVGQSPYSASKIAADKMAEAFHLSFGLPVVTVRPFNTYGPRQSARAVIPTIITQALAGQAVKLGHLHPTRDLNFVEDTVAGFLKAAECDKAVGDVFNLGNQKEISVGDLASLIGQLVGTELEIISDSNRERPKDSEVERLMADARKASDILGWQPETSLQEGLVRTIDWLKDNMHLYRVGSYVR